MSDQSALDTSGQEVTKSRFSTSFPSRFEAALQTARGAVQGIEAASGNGGAKGDLLDADSMRVYHEIFRLRIELELETAAVLWRAAESAWALLDLADMLTEKLDSGEAAVLRASVLDRRSTIVLPRPPFADRNGDAGNGDAHAAHSRGENGADKKKAHRRSWIPFRG
jgi:hypothetical protein